MKEVKFEKAIERLEEIVTNLESGNISLDEALKEYEEGVKLSRLCTEKLSQAEKKIEILTKTLNGELKAIPFELDEEDGANVGEGAKKKRQKKSAQSKKTEDSKESCAEEGTLF